MYSLFSTLTFFLVFSTPLVSAHCKINAATGDLGGKGEAFGISASAADANSQSDVTVFSGNTAFGATQAGGAINPAADLAAVIKNTGATLPQVSSGGTVTMTLHQVNADGAGPMKCSIDATAQGASFQVMTITTNVPGTNGKSNAANQDFPLVAQIPAGVACTGTLGTTKNLCLVKCENPVGPFGGVVAIQQGTAAKALRFAA
ncbi:hypothetical protein AOQ84DRAFT_377360 [Glonium stellatum]|uniref:GEgh 16 protein n=1 Tax=Glonium stellatum TaxID=574774 RepID=A0A8E2EZK4_9PEZI|nr:hypothetical protein AOQ84DRAFT_377360 [Glonium stellatum]